MRVRRHQWPEHWDFVGFHVVNRNVPVNSNSKPMVNIPEPIKGTLTLPIYLSCCYSKAITFSKANNKYPIVKTI